ncbi:MAG TPA: Hpt domain-containing protein [Gemmatimonadales bacterium]|nr:Hpt domain-containing protein [Gemmatimonadales bacterium]
MSDPVAEALRSLRRAYLEEAPARVAELHQAAVALRGRDEAAETTLTTLLHRLAGSGGAYGFPAVSVTARELEQMVRSEPEWTDARLAELEAGIGRIEAEFARAVSE